jgi:hypothetical protein
MDELPSTEPQEDLLPQLVAILTARSRDEQGRLAVGAPRRRLREALRIDEAGLDALLQSLAERGDGLGLELRDYRKAGDTWCCLTAIHGGPTELTDVEQGVLGLLVHLVLQNRRKRFAAMEEVREILVGREYLTEYQLQTVLRRLEYHGYVRRSRGTIHLDCRTALEFDEAAQKEIAEQARRLIL